MSALTWDNVSERYFDTGISHGVLYVMNDNGSYANGVAWSGLVKVSEKHSGGDAIHVYANDAPFMDIFELEEFEATLDAFTYPDEFMQCDGFYPDSNTDGFMSIGLQDRKHFALCYKTIVGNDTEGVEHGYKIHILYDCVAKPSEREWNTINDSNDFTTFSWDLYVYSVNYSGYKPTPIVVLDSRKTGKSIMGKIESYLYGNEVLNPTLLKPSEIKDLLGTHYLVTENYEPIVFGDTRILV